MDGFARPAVAGTAMLGLLLGVLLGCGTQDDRPGREPADPRAGSSETTAQDATTAAGSFAGLPPGDPPELAYVRAGRSVVQGDHSTDLEWDVEAVVAGGLVWDAELGTIHAVRDGRVDLLSSDATSPPVTDSTVTWIEDGAEIVRHAEQGPPARQPLPEGCCEAARLLGVDADADPDVLVVAPGGTWLWDTYEGREGVADPPPDSEDHLWPVGGLDGGTPAAVGIASEILVEHPDGSWGWGFVAGTRDPHSDAPVEYVEQERVRADRVWLTSSAIVALDGHGQLVVLGSDGRDDQAGHHWRGLTGGRSALGLPAGLEVDGVVAESRRTVLVDATDSSGRRAWVRCHVGLLACALATELGADDIVPER